MGNRSEFPGRDDDRTRSSGAPVSEHLDPDVVKQLSELHGLDMMSLLDESPDEKTTEGTDVDARVFEVEREDHEEALRKAAEASAAADERAKQAAAHADQGSPIAVTVSPAAARPAPTPPKSKVFTPKSDAPRQKGSSSIFNQPASDATATPAPKVKDTHTQPEITSLDDIEKHLSGVDLDNSTQPDSAAVDLAGRALIKTRRPFSIARLRRERQAHENADKAELRPVPPTPEVPQPEDPEPIEPIEIKDVIAEKPSLTPPAPEKAVPQRPTPEVPQPEDATPEAAPITVEVVRPSREHHTPTHADEHHVVHNNVPRKSFFERMGDKIFGRKTEDTQEAVVAEAPKPSALVEPAKIDTTKNESKASKDAKEVTKPEVVHRTNAEAKAVAWGERLKSPRTARDLEEYKAARPEAPEGEEYIRRSVDKNGRPIFYNQDGKQVSQDVYENYLYQHRGGTARSADVHYGTMREQGERNADHEKAIELNEAHDKESSAAIRARIEGEKLIARDPRLRGLMGLGQELQGLSNVPEDQKERMAAFYEQKRQMFDDLVELYRSQGVDARAIDYILHETIFPTEHENYNPIKGSVFYKGEKATVLDYIESPDGKQVAYTLQLADGTVISDFGQNLEFKREYEKTPEAPEETEKLSKLQQLKNWFSKGKKQRQEFGGSAYWSARVHDASDKLMSGNTEGLTLEEIDEKRKKVRRNIIIGSAVVTGVAMIGTYGLGVATGHAFAAIQDALSPDAIPPTGIGSGAGEAVGSAAAAGFGGETGGADISGGSDFFNDALDPRDFAADRADQLPAEDQPHGHWDNADSVPEGINDSRYNIPENQNYGGIKLFDSFDLSEATWYENAGTLAQMFPQDFKFVGNDVQITHSGLLSEDARRYIEAIRSR